MQITKFSIHQTSKLVGLVCFCFTLVIVPLFLVLAFSDVPDSSKWFLLLAPLGYGLVGYAFTAFACVIYNFLAKQLGGIEFSTTGSASESKSNDEHRNV